MEDAQELWIPQPLPGMNDIITKCKGKARLRNGAIVAGMGYSSMKSSWSDTIRLIARATGFGRVEKGHFTFVYVEPNRRRDPDNICAGARKIVFDALQEAKLLQNDGWTHVLDIRSHWLVDGDSPGVGLLVHPSRVFERKEVEEWLKNKNKNHK